MTDEQIEQLRKELKNNELVMWSPDSKTARKIYTISPCIDENNELCAYFLNSEYVALYNCSISDFVVGKRLG